MNKIRIQVIFFKKNYFFFEKFLKFLKIIKYELKKIIKGEKIVENLYLKATKKSLSTENLLVNRKMLLLKKAQEIEKQKAEFTKSIQLGEVSAEKGFLKDLLLSEQF